MTDTPTVPGPGTGKAVVLIAVAGLFAYFNSLHGVFVLDDLRFVQDPNIGRPFHNSFTNRPVIAVTLAANYQLDGLNPRGYHLFNLVVHVAAGVVLFDLVRRTLLLPRFAARDAARAGWVGLAAALIWLVHPLNTQSVTYTVQRCESLMGLFFLAAVWCFIRGATAVGGGAWWYLAAAANSALGTGCKEVTIALSPVLLVYDRTFLAGSWVAAVRRRWWVYALVALPPVLLLLRVALAGVLTDVHGTAGLGVPNFTPVTYALTQTEVILYYLRLAVWPSPLCLDYLDWPAKQSLADAWPTVAGLGALAAATAYGVARGRAWGFLGAWFFLILAPSSSILPLQDPAFEHRMYLPLAAVVVLVVVGASELAGRVERASPRLWPWPDRVAAAAAGVVVVALGLATVVRNEDYSSRMRLYGDVVAKRPGNYRAQFVYADLLSQSGRPAEAEAHLRAALATPRQVPGTLAQYGAVLLECDRAAEAVSWLERAHAQYPADTEVSNRLGIALLVVNRPEAAVQPLREAIGGETVDPTAHLHLALALLGSGRGAEADAEFATLKRLAPDYYRELAAGARHVALDPEASAEKARLAALYATAAARLADPAGPDVLDTEAIALARAGRFAEAARVTDRAAAAAERAGWEPYQVGLLRSRGVLYRSNRPYLPASSPD